MAEYGRITKEVTADVGKDGCVRTKHTRIMGACSIPEVRSVRVEPCSGGDSSDECCYVEVDPTDSNQVPPPPTPSPAKSRTTSASEPEGKAAPRERRTCVLSSPMDSIKGHASLSHFVGVVAEWYRYRTVACLVTSSSPVPLKTRRVGQRWTLNLSRAETSSR
ncbi:uncharacterized protein TNCV_235031 [Trichonephila clavipes]|uniref:Uncharacterized protein n=1 Tax=Trichonephila clavipes TaxID=2585209 RepID=A0A8X6SP06_TRICX|nr:uncharacterized protein TNCV_235031 [Trichonephila clavipes]